ncbi:lysozyme inhibitor LprI family protein [Roseovarius sp. MMSF_3281]|uniref:lysozyme inhibitor LprI family protein n=1 Tax=Roseovarius sp. MMSF_3281 TaxID=3046694 RepID=UPI00273F7C7D|nr:lysozyme inhibitor LprI family protein [Roseovarius sp. MMSF_3281]
MRWITLCFTLILPLMAHAQTASRSDVAQIEECVRNYSKGAPQERVIGGCVGIIDGACRSKTTIEIADCIMRETAAWDHLLNAWWKPMKERAQADGSWNRLLDAQRQWIKERDAECQRVYDEWRGGTIRVIFAAECQRDLTAKRAVEFYYALNK